MSVLWTYKYFMIFWISIQKEYALHPTTMRKPHFAQAFLPRDSLGGFFSLAATFWENTFCRSSENWSSLGYKKWFLWIRGAISQVQIVYLFLSLFCNEPTWLAYHHQKKSESMETPQNWMFYLEILQFSPKLAHLYR